MREQRMANVLNGMGDVFSDTIDALVNQENTALFGTPDVYSAVTATPPVADNSSGFSFSDLGNILNAAGQVYSFTQKLDAAGNPIPSPAPPVSSGVASKISPAILIMLGIGAFLVLR